MSKVADVMTRDVFWLDEDSLLGAAAFEMNAEFVGGAPVRNASGKLVGVLSKTDLLSSRRQNDPRRVREVMTEDVATVQQDAPVADAARLMLERRIHRVLVVGADGNVVGIVTPLDVLADLERQGALG